MKNKGFSLVECIFCIVFLSGSIIGITSFLTYLKNDYRKKEYESQMSMTHYAIFTLFDSDPANALDNYINYLGGIVLDDGTIEIKVKLRNTYKSKDEIIYNVKLVETDISYKIEVNLEGIVSRYEGINQEEISTREVKK